MPKVKNFQISNLAVSKENILDVFPKINKNTPKKIKFVNIVCSFYSRAIVFSWSAKNIGFGQLTYAIDKNGKLNIDDEGLDSDFLDQLQNEIVKRFKKNNLEIKIDLKDIKAFFQFTNSFLT